MIERHQERDVEAATVLDADGADLGAVRHVFLDHETGRPEWAVVDVPTGPRFVPLFSATLQDGRVSTSVQRGLVESSPAYDPDAGHLSAADEEDLYAHYGFGPDGSLLPGETEAQDYRTPAAGPDPADGMSPQERIALETNIEASEGFLDDEQRSLREDAVHRLDDGRRDTDGGQL